MRLEIYLEDQMNKITRVELFTPKGREFQKLDCKEVKTEVQDDGRTLKVFIK